MEEYHYSSLNQIHLNIDGLKDELDFNIDTNDLNPDIPY